MSDKAEPAPVITLLKDCGFEFDATKSICENLEAFKPLVAEKLIEAAMCADGLIKVGDEERRTDELVTMLGNLLEFIDRYCGKSEKKEAYHRWSDPGNLTS